MGCGQSKIHLYPRKSKSKTNGKKSGHVDTDADADEDEGHVGDRDKEINKERIDDEGTLSDGKGSPEPNGEINVPILRPKNVSLLQSQDISSSQQNFFRMLDQKIEDGPDYDSSSETEMALEQARLTSLFHHWESASLSASICSSTSPLQNTPVRQPMRQAAHQLRPQQPLSVEMLSQQQLKQPNMSPKRDARTPLSQTIIHQGYGVTQHQTNSRISPRVAQGQGILMGSLPLSYYPQQQPAVTTQAYYGDMVHHPLQQVQSSPEPRFPPAISVQRLAPQVQRQLRETQELIKDSCPQMYAAGYGSPGPPMRATAQSQRVRRTPTLETQYSQELS
ncbi:uncharacterized protein LOC129793654 isoform X2 [Lutzomyia longipalpis]|uniref:uncharacterized protein LOC129793654 isoform X2 n=1 Tax=Lutzomyia longipalpis TaxID=7200 RepID=UPI00248406B9|nr:uncharacterized protein LOC129793654 isoform X2 [Lutzomyia longipalpis]